MTPALAEGASWDPEALSHIIRVAGGYPYFLQEYGSVAWNVALGPVITPHDAVVAEQFGQTKLDAGFFASRWGRATPADAITSVRWRPTPADTASPVRSPAEWVDRLAHSARPAPV